MVIFMAERACGPMYSSEPPIPDADPGSEPADHRLETLLPVVYAQLHDLARMLIRRERPGHTLQPTALINEVYLRLSQQASARWRNRPQFLAVAAQAMRRILVDSARHHRAAKRGSGHKPRPLHEIVLQSTGLHTDVVALDDALGRLAALDPRAARLVELRYFAGLTMEEAAEVLGVSASTAERDWRSARAWLYRALSLRDTAAPPGNTDAS